MNEEDDITEFSWRDTESVVVRAVNAIAVYRNPDGDVVIRQEAAIFGDDDPFIVVPENALPRLIEALKEQLAG